jgi:hypothetical protein
MAGKDQAMDPISLLFTAVVSGAASALKPTAEKAVVDGYAALKAYLKRKWPDVSVDALERNPGSESRQQILKEDLATPAGADDRELLAQAQALLKTIADHDAKAAAETANIDVKDIEAGANATLDDIIAQGSISIQRVKATGDVSIKGLRAGNPPQR